MRSICCLENIDRIETNLQIAHAPKSAVRDFRTDYLLKVFNYDAHPDLREAPLENQIDRDRLLTDDQLWSASSRRGCSIPNILPNSTAARS